MPGARSSFKPLSAGGSSGESLDEVSQLELHLQRQLEEDVARIFDESIYSDLEVVCGKLKILTHSCILKARTHKFFHKLEAILHVNIGRNTFDEIYSFISDAYTECDIQHQENEIFRYLKEKLNLKPEAIEGDWKSKLDDLDESDAYATPNCLSPEESSLQKTISSSPSTELTKEYYALVPLDGQILDKELIEQDELSSAFKSFIHLRTENTQDKQITQCIKPTTLSLNSSHVSKINKHSIICDTSKDSKDIESNSFLFENDKSKINNATSQVRKHLSEINKGGVPFKRSLNGDTNAGNSTYSPDSLIADDPSSSSDYLSTALSASPGGSHADAPPPRPNMNNTLPTVSDSGYDNNGMLESVTSHKDATLADVSLTESTLHELLNDETAAGQSSASNALETKQAFRANAGNSQNSFSGAYKPVVEMSGRSSKDEKQRQNEEIVILESSSLSSEAGSWESVFPPKMPEKDLCEKFINIERHNSIEPLSKVKAYKMKNANTASQSTDEVQRSSSKSTCCFIDASTLADEEERQLEQVMPFTSSTNFVYRASSRPVPCEPKQDVSPNDYSESHDNDDSLEQPDPDSIQKDISPTIFEITFTTEDSIVDTFEDEYLPEHKTTSIASTTANKAVHNNAKPTLSHNVCMSTTPHNSIISLNASDFKTYDSESSDNDAASYKRGSNSSVNSIPQMSEKTTATRPHAIRQDILFEDFNKKCNESSLILSGASIEDHFPQMSPVTKRKIENIPIVSGAYIPPEVIKPVKTTKVPSTAASWVVDMSKCSMSENSTSNRNTKPGDKTCDLLKASSRSTSYSDGSKSRSSVDSDSSEKSTHKFYIDLATLPDALAPEQNNATENNEKKNIFSMFIDLGENSSTVKEMPARLSSSLNAKKASKVETKNTVSKVGKSTKKLPNIKNNTDTFETLESLCNSSQMSVSEIIKLSVTKKIGKEQQQEDSLEVHEYHRTFPRESVAPTIREEPDPDQPCDIFVRLSDLDRAPVQKNDSGIETTMKTECFERMTRSIPDNNWGESSQTSSRSIDIISSFHSENALSLNRLFPHLKNDISRSMPGSLSGRTRSPFRLAISSNGGDREEIVSDVSDMSSVHSSMCRSVVENSTTEDTSDTSSLLIHCQSRLGQDLLRMFMEEIAPDVVVEVSGRRIKAHKCILSSRCQYFAGILSGGWVESAGNVISLPPFSFGVVHFALCHIYSGISKIPDSISIVELATIADMLGLEGLKEAIMFTLKAKYCHHFHEPCQVCTAGVLECFPLSSVYGLDELYRRCLRWITKHFSKVWPTKAFATLPSELLDKCYQELLLNLTTDNFVDTVYDCGLTVASLYRCRWAEVVARLCRRLMAAAAQFAATRYCGIVRVACASRAAPAPCAAHALDDCLASAAALAAPDELCRALPLLHAARDRARPDLLAESAPHAERVADMRRRTEEALLRAASRALAAPAFCDLPHELRRRLRDRARRQPPDAPPTALPAPRRSPRRAEPPAPIDRVRASFVPYAPRPQPPPQPPQLPQPRRQPDAPRPALSLPRVRTTKAQEERAKFNLSKSIGAQPQEKASGRTRASYSSARPRYMEPRAGAARRGGARLVSSSESSRNSSPVLPRARPRTADPSTDSLSDSLNADKYATYTKTTRRDPHLLPVLQQSKTQTTSTQPGKVRATKIPVYLNTSAANGRRAPAPGSAGSKEPSARAPAASAPRHRGSLMMATKSSSAKVVTKIVKEAAAQVKGGKNRARSPVPADIPVMERSGTFLKDEPTFGNITNIDIDE